MTAMLYANLGLSADFDVMVRRFDEYGNHLGDDLVIEKCKNLITNAGLNALGPPDVDFNGFSNFCFVGTGTGTPAFTDTALFNKIAAVQAGGAGDGEHGWDVAGGRPKTLYLKRVFQFPVGAAVGTLTELGLSNTATGQTLTHALFKDAFGDPTTVLVGANDQLFVTYRVYITPNETDSVFVTTQNGTEYTITARYANLGRTGNVYYRLGPSFSIYGIYFSWIPRWDVDWFAGYGPNSAIGPTNNQSSTSTWSPRYRYYRSLGARAYTADSYYIDEYIVASANEANFSDVGVIHIQSSPFDIQVQISPRINKTNIDTFKLTIRTSWGRA